jgi:colanic acid/amylovoran biosynthesis glycosyltransferase
MSESGLVLAVCEPGRDIYSETFIRAHVDRLPGKVYHLHSNWPDWANANRRLIPLPLRVAVRHRGKLPEALGRIIDRGANESLARFLRTKKVRVVLAEYGPTAVSLVDLCQQANLPLVAHFHGYDAYHHEVLEANRVAYARLFRMAAAVVAVSHDMVHQLIALGAPENKVFYNSYGVDPGMFSPGDPSANPPDFLSVGRFVDKKAPQLTILAFHRALREAPQARLRMVGDGPLREACCQMVLALGLKDRVEFLGKQKPEEVSRLMRRARAFVQHSVTASYGDCEGTPVAVLEASASGLPILATRHAGIKEAVVEAETGLLVEERDVEGMARNIVRMVKEPETAREMGVNGRGYVNRHYAMEKAIGGLWAILTRAAERAS